MPSAFAVMLMATPLSAVAENINIYGWQNYSYEFVDVDRTFENNSYFINERKTGGYVAADNREFDRIQGNAANIGFISHMDTGLPGLQVGLRCEQFTFHNRSTSSGWCNRNSKISLRHETAGEIMFGQWLLPYNEIVAAWVDPFYDAGADSHTSIMGNIGFGGVFYNGGTFPLGSGTDFSFEGLYALSFNRRQEEIIQYVWPNTSDMASQAREGFQFRFAMTSGSNDEAHLDNADLFAGVSKPDGYVNSEYGNGATDGFKDSYYDLDPRIWSTGVSWQHNLANGDQVWLALAYEKHEDITALELARPTHFPAEQYGAGTFCEDSDDDAYRIAGRYSHDWGNGQRTWIAAMYEQMEYDADNCKRRLESTGSLEPHRTLWDDVERDSWMISGKHSFGNGFDIRFSYMDADELDCQGGVCGEPGFYGEYGGFGDTSANSDKRRYNKTRANVTHSGNGALLDPPTGDNTFRDKDTDAQAYNLGVYYTMPSGTELRLTYSRVDNEDNAGYDFGIGNTNLWNVTDDGKDEDVEMIAVGIVHWFD